MICLVTFLRTARKEHEANAAYLENARKHLQSKLDSQRKENKLQAAQLAKSENNYRQLGTYLLVGLFCCEHADENTYIVINFQYLRNPGQASNLQ